jgi:hypothetical protein
MCDLPETGYQRPASFNTACPTEAVLPTSAGAVNNRSGGWRGNFALRDRLICTGGAPYGVFIKLNFPTPAVVVGTQMQLVPFSFPPGLPYMVRIEALGAGGVC